MAERITAGIRLELLVSAVDNRVPGGWHGRAARILGVTTARLCSAIRGDVNSLFFVQRLKGVKLP
ncbi:MAG: hypothetical protein EPN91_02170 [Salinibacterium sp.]|nr:MAG: hypothetical protein EPN91_02170 [Salinibacterium sp.]